MLLGYICFRMKSLLQRIYSLFIGENRKNQNHQDAGKICVAFFFYFLDSNSDEYDFSVPSSRSR